MSDVEKTVADEATDRLLAAVRAELSTHRKAVIKEATKSATASLDNAVKDAMKRALDASTLTNTSKRRKDDRDVTDILGRVEDALDCLEDNKMAGAKAMLTEGKELLLRQHTVD